MDSRHTRLNKQLNKQLIFSILAGMMWVAGSATAQVTVSDNFTGATNTQPWIVTGGACLTAGTSSSTAGGQIPACSPTSTTSGTGEGGYGGGPCANGTTYATGCFNAGHMDPAGNGALRLTNSQGDLHSAIVWNNTFPSTAGISITFSAVSYDGDSQNGDGADGLSFFLLDASAVAAAAAASPAYTTLIGAWGGSLAYSCSNSNSPHTGSLGGYVGLGIDEYGNFLNAGDNTATGATAPNGSGIGANGYGGNAQSNPANNNAASTSNIAASVQSAQRIGLRGMGQVNWYQLNNNFPSFYPGSTANDTAIQNTCESGTVWNYSGATITNVSTGNVNGASFTGTISSNTQLTVSSVKVGGVTVSGNANIDAVMIGGAVNGTNVHVPQSICAVATSGSVYTLCQNNVAVSSEAMTIGPCTTGSSSCGGTVGPVASGGNMNCAVLVSGLPVTWAMLTAAQPTYYPSTLTAGQQNAAVVSTCETGTIWNYSTPASPVNTWNLISNSPNINGVANIGYVPNAQVLFDYKPIANANLAFPETLANESAGARGNATSRTYNLKITSGGLLSLNYADNSALGVPGTTVPVLTNSPIFTSNGPLPANFTFGFAGSTGGSVNIHEIMCFQAAPADTSDSSIGVNMIQTGQVKTGTQIYLAYYHSNNWWGQLTSQNLVYNAGTNTVTIQTAANWDSSCELTGDITGAATSTLPGGNGNLPVGNCKATASTSDTAQSPTSRAILTWSGAAGIPFEWANLTSAQQTLFNNDGNGHVRLNYLRGDRSNEVNATGTSGLFRTRISVLGDIIDSSPTWVGAPLMLYPSGAGASSSTWLDLLYPAGDAMPENTNTYGSYQSANSGRLNIVFVGANDGMMHGFEAGSFGGSGAFSSTNNTGQEVIAYMPNAVVSTIHNTSNATLDYSAPGYNHNYYVDATPGVGDLYYGGAWHTWLVGGLGAGGNAVFALDITNPGNFSETNASSLVIGEWSAATAGLGTNLGQTFGTPIIKRFHNGNWGFVFGNGYNAPSHNGGVFVGLVSSTGAVSFTFLPLPASAAGTASLPNGIFSAYPADLDSDSVADYIYAGDLYGNVWRWDVTSQSAATWASTLPIRLFTTPGGSAQPISTQVQAVSVPNPGGSRRIMVDFGTGAQVPSSSSTTLAVGQQALYGIWDGNVSTWNTEASAANQYDPYPSTFTGPVLSSALQAQTITATGFDGVNNYRKVSNTAICWADLSNCIAPLVNNQYGWEFVFAAPSPTTGSGEQVVYNPVIQDGAFVVNTYIPSVTQSCTTSNPTGWTMAINPATGGAFQTSFFVNAANIVESGVQLAASGSPSFVVANSVAYLISQTLGGTTGTGGGTVSQIQPPAGQGYRLNWTELR